MRDIGIDLGTNNTRIYIEGNGIVLNEASMLAIEDNKIIAVGNEAKNMVNRTSDLIKIIKPIENGVIADFTNTEEMLKRFLKQAFNKKRITMSRLLFSVPSNITQVEKNALLELASRLGTKKVLIEEEAKLAALGTGIDITKSSASMIINIGEGITNIAILSLGQVVLSKSINIAGNTFNKSIIDYLKEKYKISIGETTIEEIKLTLGNSLETIEELKEVTGRNLETGLPTTISITKKDLIEAIKPDIQKIILEIKNILEELRPEILADIKHKGIILTGGASLIVGLIDNLKKEIKIPIFISDNPLTDTIEGMNIILENTYLINNRP